MHIFVPPREPRHTLAYLREVNDLLRKANHQYYNSTDVMMSDYDYDNMFRELSKYLDENPEYIPDIPGLVTQSVGSSPLNSFGTVNHLSPMISLDNVFNEDEFRFWMSNPQRKKYASYYNLELKYDGLACSIVYQGGSLARAATRGDGLKGEDITPNVMQIKNVPLEIKDTTTIEIRGEIVIGNQAFRLLNKQLEKEGRKPFANPRNAAAGSIRLLSPKDVAKRPLTFIAYEVLVDNKRFATHTQAMQYVNLLGFETAQYTTPSMHADNFVEVYKEVNETRNSLKYPIDGVVIKVDSYEERVILGENQRVPYWAIAFKLPPSSAIAKLHDVEWQVGRTGKLTPVAIFKEAVPIFGVMVKRCTLNNMNEIERLGLCYDDNVHVERSGDVIPKIISVHSHSGCRKIDAPLTCPVCEGVLARLQDGGAHLYCLNPACKAVALGQLTYWVSREVMDIKGLGESILQVLQAHDLVKRIPDLYRLHQYRVKLLNIDGFGESSVDAILSAIDASRCPTFDRFITGLSIFGIAKTTARQIAMVTSDIGEFIDISLVPATSLELFQVGEVQAYNLYHYVNYNYQYIQDLHSLIGGTKPFIDAREVKGMFDGMRFCITGSFENFTREQIMMFILQNGGEVATSVTKTTSGLICGSNAGSKLARAEGLEVPVYNEAWLLDQMKGV